MITVDRLRLQTPDKLFIDGEFVDALDGSTFVDINPHDGSALGDVAQAGEADVDRAVAAARRAFPAWSRMAAAERGRLLLKLADTIEAHAEELARLESIDTGHPIRDSRRLDVPRTANTFRYFGGMADKHEGSVIPAERGFLNYLLREPIGVVGQIVATTTKAPAAGDRSRSGMRPQDPRWVPCALPGCWPSVACGIAISR